MVKKADDAKVMFELLMMMRKKNKPEIANGQT